MKKILVVVVLHHPEKDNLMALIKNCLSPQNVDVFVSDNGGVEETLKNEIERISVERVIYHDNKRNLGVAGGQNKGLSFAIEKNYDCAILFDQDTTIDNLFIVRLDEEFKKVRVKDPKVIAAGPSFIDPRFQGERASKKVVKENQYRNMVISSGCIISVSELKDVGLMDELLFIDRVDTEWCYRAASKGYQIIQLSDVVMDHTIGQVKKLWWGYKLQYHHKIRYYYLARNSIILFERKYIPLTERVLLFLRNFFYMLKICFLKDSLEYFRLMIRGFGDGIKELLSRQ